MEADHTKKDRQRPNLIHLPDDWARCLPSEVPSAYRIAIVAICNALARLVKQLCDKKKCEEPRVTAFEFDPNDPHRLKSLPSIQRKIMELLSEANKAMPRCHVRNSKIEIPEEVKRSLKPQALKILKDYRRIDRMSPEERTRYFLTLLDDVARCRILCLYESDLEDLHSRFKELLPPLLASGGVKKSKEARPIFKLLRRKKDLRYEEGPPFKSAGHRAIHRYVEVHLDKEQFVVEIQLMTMLQNVWDRMEHPIYGIRRELERSKGNVGKTPFEMRSLSGLLVVADKFAADTWKKFLKKLRKKFRYNLRPSALRTYAASPPPFGHLVFDTSLQGYEYSTFSETLKPK